MREGLTFLNETRSGLEQIGWKATMPSSGTFAGLPVNMEVHFPPPTPRPFAVVHHSFSAFFCVFLVFFPFLLTHTFSDKHVLTGRGYARDVHITFQALLRWTAGERTPTR
eukprot:824538-Rhodomonas_salina.4